MKYKLYVTLLLAFAGTGTFAQNRNSFSRKADSLYQAKNYAQAGPYYVKAADAAEYKAVKKITIIMPPAVTL